MTTICLCSYKSPKLLERILESIDEARSPNLDSLYLNFAGDKESEEVIKKSKYGINFGITTEEPIGFPKAYNRILEYAVRNGSNILVITDDVEPIGNDWLSELENTLNKNPKVGAVAGMELFIDPETKEEYTLLPHSGKRITRQEADQITESQDLVYCGGGFSLFRWEALVKVGLFDENFTPGYYEDYDVGLRLWLAGYRCTWAPKVKFYHKRGSTFSVHYPGFYPSRQAEYHQRKWDWLIDKMTSEELLPKLRRIVDDRHNGVATNL